PRRRHWSKARGRATPSACRMSRALRSSPILPKGSSARGRGRSSPPLAPIRNIPTCRRATPRRCANGTPRARRNKTLVVPAKAGTPTGGEMIVKSYLCGPYSRFGFLVALVACVLDQASKLYLLDIFDLANRSPVHLGPFFDLVLARNTGISYGLFQTQSMLGHMLLLGFKVIAVVLLWAWLSRARELLTALSLGLIIGGAVGNAIDRLAY